MERKRRIHEDDLVDKAEREAAALYAKTFAAESLEQWRQDHFGFLTRPNNDDIKRVIADIKRRP